MSTYFQHIISIQRDDIDGMNHVNNVVYLRYAQEVAEAHWLTKGSADFRKQFHWVVLRHEIDYLAPATFGQTLLGKTWVEQPEGPKFLRHVELYNNDLHKISAKVKTTWCLLDATTLRPKRIEGEMMEVFK